MAPLTHLTLFFSMLAASALGQSDYAPSSVTVTHTVTHTLETCAGESSTAGTSYTTTTVTSTTEKTITIHKTRHSSSTSDGSITPFLPTITIKPTPKPSIVSIHNVTLTRASTLPAFTTCTDPACRPYQLPTPDMSHHSSANATLPASPTSSHFTGSTITIPCYTQSSSYVPPSFKTSTSPAPSTSMSVSPVTTNGARSASDSLSGLALLVTWGLMMAKLVLQV